MHGREQWKFRRITLDSMSVRIEPSPELVNRYHRSEFKIAFSRGLYVSQVDYSSKKEPYIILSVPLLNNKGVLFAKLDLNQMWQWISEVKIGETGYAFVVDRNGDLIAHPEKERVLLHTNCKDLPVVKRFIECPQEASSKWSTYDDELGRKVFALYENLPEPLVWAVITQVPAEEVYRPINKMYLNIFLWTLFWTVVFLIVGYRFVQHIIQPLLLLQSGVQKISQGKLDINLGVHTGDEIEGLAQNFEKMAIALKQLEDLRQDLIRMIIHDLKSPLSGIMGSLDYLESGLLGEMNDEQKKIVSLAKKSSDNLLGMIQNLLDVAKMEEGKLDLRREPVDIAMLLSERKNQYEPLVLKESKIITLELDPGLPVVNIEKGLIERVVNNLVSNAINHTSAGGKITVSAKKLRAVIEISVTDNGAGIPSEYKEKIFEKFVQIQRKQAHLRTGAGLGLTFCKMVVETHGGLIRVESELNKGSSFIFTLPLS
jgi:signal transduction histidine kinase